MAEILSKYKNGNYEVTLYSDGTKEKVTEDDNFISEFPDSMDIKITEYCDLNCVMCHERSTVNGKHATFNQKFLDTLPSGIELAIGGGNPFSHPELVSFLKRMKDKGIICNITVNEVHLWKYIDLIKELLEEKLIYGLGISLSLYKDETFEFLENNPNTVAHIILGLVDFDKLFKYNTKNFKVLILGYKRFGRGEEYYHINHDIDKGIRLAEANFNYLISHFKAIGFDNLALEQLHVKKHLPKKDWDEFYMGEDGTSTMYVDLVKNEFSISSTTVKRYKLLDDIRDMMKFLHDIK